MTHQKIQCNMPIKADAEAEKDQGSNLQTVNFFKPLPDIPGTTHTNEVFIPLFSPANWALFNPTEEMSQKLGMSLTNPLRGNSSSELYTFYFKIATHKVSNFVRPDGSTGFAQVVCPVKLNYYLEKHIQYKPLFIKPRCPFCEAEAKAWVEFNDRWSKLGIDKKNLSKDGYRSMVKDDPVLSETRDRAYSLRAFDRIVMNVFDYAKFTGSRPLTEGEQLGYQTWFAPKAVLNALTAANSNANDHGISPFYDFYNSNGLQLVNVVKNTERCTQGNFRDTTYTCFPGVTIPFDDNWKVYLTNLSNMPDPSSAFLTLPYEEALYYANQASDSATDYNSASIQAQAPAPVVPQAQAPVIAPPPNMGPDSPEAVPTASAPSLPPPSPSIPAVSEIPDRSDDGSDDAYSDEEGDAYPDGIQW